MTAAKMPKTIALINPPFFLNDFKSPYLAMPHLAGFLRQNGVMGVDLVDANMAMWQVLRSPEFLKQTSEEMGRRLSSLAKTDTEQRRELLYYRFLLDHVMEHPERLIEQPGTINLYSGIVFDLFYAGVRRSIPSQIDAVEHGTTMPMLDRTMSGVVNRLDPETRLLGITVPTADQFLPALLLAKAAKAHFGEQVTVALGGCIFSLLNRIAVFDLMACPYVDCVGVHEGEWTMLGLAEHVEDGRQLSTIPNLIYREGTQVRATSVRQPPLLNESAAPYFPSEFLQEYGQNPRLPVWATRGCYWGKCTFCDYIHLSSNNNNAETIQVSRLVDQIEALSNKHGTAQFELITECLSPSFSRRFSSEIISRRLDLRWTTHVKVEKSFDAETCLSMKSAGCHRVTIGVESFSERQLEVMKKGCSTEDVLAMLSNLKRAGIWTSINIIVDFPTVEDDQARETLDALVTYRHLFDNVNVFPFVLSLLTDIARAPADFGVTVLDSPSERHNRGFHFAQFERVSGISQEQARDWLGRYQRFGFGHKRTISAEVAFHRLGSLPLDRLTVRPAERFQRLDDETRKTLTADGLAEQAASEDETLVFDLESKRTISCLPPILDLYEALPSRPISAIAIGDLVQVDMTRPDGEGFIRQLLSYGADRGIFVIGCVDQSDELLYLVYLATLAGGASAGERAQSIISATMAN